MSSEHGPVFNMSGRISAGSDDEGVLTLVQRPTSGCEATLGLPTSSTRHVVESAHEEIHV